MTLTRTIGAHTLQVRAAGLPDRADGVALRFMLYDRPMSFSLTNHEARALIVKIEQQLAAAEARR